MRGWEGGGGERGGFKRQNKNVKVFDGVVHPDPRRRSPAIGQSRISGGLHISVLPRALAPAPAGAPGCAVQDPSVGLITRDPAWDQPAKSAQKRHQSPGEVA